MHHNAFSEAFSRDCHPSSPFCASKRGTRRAKRDAGGSYHRTTTHRCRQKNLQLPINTRTQKEDAKQHLPFLRQQKGDAASKARRRGFIPSHDHTQMPAKKTFSSLLTRVPKKTTPSGTSPFCASKRGTRQAKRDAGGSYHRTYPNPLSRCKKTGGSIPKGLLDPVDDTFDVVGDFVVPKA